MSHPLWYIRHMIMNDDRDLLFVIGVGVASFIIILLTGIYIETL